MAVEPKTKVDQEKMAIALQRLAEEDPTFRVFTNEDTGQTIMAGMGELHLEILRDRMLREFKVDTNAGKPQIAYRETITKDAHGVGKLIKQSGGRGQYGHVEVDVRPAERGKGFTIENKIVGGTIPKEYIPAVKKGLEEAVLNGVARRLPGHRPRSRYRFRPLPRRRFQRTGVQDGGHFRAQGCRQERQADPARADHEGREHHSRGISGRYHGRSQPPPRADQCRIETKLGLTTINAEVPLAEMFGYATAIRSLSKGRSSYSMEPSHFEQVPEQVKNAVLEQKGTNLTHDLYDDRPTHSHPPQGIRSSDARRILRGDRRDRQAHGRKGGGPHPAAHPHRAFTVNRSPHVDKKSMDQFEIRTHKRLLDIVEPTAKTVDELKKLNLPAGVDITIKI